MNQRVIDSDCKLCGAELFSDHDKGYTIHVNPEKLQNQPDVENYLAMLWFCNLTKPGAPVVIAIGKVICCQQCFQAGLDQITEVLKDATKN